MRKTFIEEKKLRELSQVELLHKINTEELSLLKSIGADELRKEMEVVGFLCRMLIDMFCPKSLAQNNAPILNQDQIKYREKSTRLLKLISPAKLAKPLATFDNAIVIGFNHPSLGEIFRLLYLGFERYPERKFLFPVNIPWYEALTPSIEKLKYLGIYITPMITPSTEKKLLKKFADNETMLSDINHYKIMLERKYMRTAREMSKENCVIFVAPSATRQAEVFPDNDKSEEHIHPTMTILARMILRDENVSANFIPVTIIEPKKNNRKLNLFKNYSIIPCTPFSCEELRDLISQKGKLFDYKFLERIDKEYKKN